MSAGKFLGRYELIEQLGQGGMGEVWMARLTGAAGFEKPALLKSVLPRLAGDAQFVARFQHEGKLLVHLQHANIAQVMDMGEAEGTLYIALEYVMGVDVSRLHDGHVTWSDRTRDFTEARDWAGTFERIALATPADLDSNGDYYIDVRMSASPRRTFTLWPFGSDVRSGRAEFTFIR